MCYLSERMRMPANSRSQIDLQVEGRICLPRTLLADDGAAIGILDFLTDDDNPVAAELCKMCEFRIGKAASCACPWP